MEITAEPQPSSLCFTYGTSSQIPAFSWVACGSTAPAKSKASNPSENSSLAVVACPRFEELAQRKRQYDDAQSDHDNPKQITVGNPASGEIALRPARPLGELGEIGVTQLPHGLIHLLVGEIRGFQRFLPQVGRKKSPNRFFIGLARLGRPRGINRQIAQGDDMLVLLGPCWNCGHAKQRGHRQHRHTPLSAKTHSSSSAWLG
jgi:hypothetical protein